MKLAKVLLPPARLQISSPLGHYQPLTSSQRDAQPRDSSPALCWPIPIPRKFGTWAATQMSGATVQLATRCVPLDPTTGFTAGVCGEGGRRTSCSCQKPQGFLSFLTSGGHHWWQQEYKTVRQEVKPDQS